MKPNNGLKKLGIALAILGSPMLMIGVVATAFSSTTLSITITLVGIAFLGLAFIILTDVLE